MTAHRVLVVDDDPDIVHFVRVNLELEGFEVVTAGDGQEAVDAVMESRPDLVLLDVMMPGMDGISTLRQLRSHPAAANTSVILLTAKALPEDRVRGLELGADDYVTKPFSFVVLVARLKAIVRRSADAPSGVVDMSGFPLVSPISPLHPHKESTKIEARATDSRCASRWVAACCQVAPSCLRYDRRWWCRGPRGRRRARGAPAWCIGT